MTKLIFMQTALKNLKISLFFLIIQSSIVFCKPNNPKHILDSSQKKTSKSFHKLIRKDTIILLKFSISKIPVSIHFSDSAIGNILVLPGWNFPDTQWCEKTELCKKAMQEKFNLIFVEMQRSVYLKEYYPETKKAYTHFPTRTWLYKNVWQMLKSNDIIDSLMPSYVMGLSTGGRGAAIMALEYPADFNGAATLSGDFDPTFEKNDKLMINSLGNYLNHKKRWNGDNNMLNRAKEFKVPLYIGHGKKDKVCTIKQSENFCKELKLKNPNLKIVCHFADSMGHDYRYWNSEVNNVLMFFKSCNTSKK